VENLVLILGPQLMLKIAVVSYPHLGSLAFISFSGFLGSNVLTSGAWLIRSNEVAMVMVVDVVVGVVDFSRCCQFYIRGLIASCAQFPWICSPNRLFPAVLGCCRFRQSE
jgi:hypothetical protein